jgi:nitroreductase
MKKLLKQIFSIISKFYKSKIQAFIQHLSYKSRVLSSIYYSFFSFSFMREHQAVLSGKIKYINDVRSEKSNFVRLVRNIHRIEKGLLMIPRRSKFAVDYITETMDSYEGVLRNNNSFSDKQIKWFKDVLSRYFEVVDSSLPVIIEQNSRFISINEKVNCSIIESESCKKSIPYLRDKNQFSNISYEQFFKLCVQRRSVRWFLNKSVSRDLIDKAILAAAQSPSACNRQPFSFKIFDDPELVKQVVEFPMGTRGYAQNIQIFVVVVGDLSAYFDERDRHLIYIDASLANMSFMLALETLGLSSCPINWPDIERRERKMDQFLKLKKFERPIMCLGIGYPDPKGMVAFSEKRELGKIRKYN